MIPLEIRSKERVTDEMRAFAERRVCSALCRFRNIRRVVILLEDLNGPKGGKDKFCRIVAEVGSAPIILEETQQNWYAALSRATHRLAQTVTRYLHRIERPSPRCEDRMATEP